MLPLPALRRIGVSALIGIAPAALAVEIETGTYDGVRLLTISGEFLPRENPAQLARALVTFDPDLVTFDSPGGNIYSAMHFGRALRTFGATTVQLRGNECASACALAFFGGALRFAEPGSIGMHKASFLDDSTLSKEDAVSAVQSSTADVLAYLVEMGIDPSLMQLALRYESWDVRYLSGSEMAQHNVTTGDPETDMRPSAPADDAPVARQPPASEPATRLTTVDDARSGLVRRPKGYAPIMSEPSTQAREIRVLQNGSRLAILGANDRWFRVRSGEFLGWMHHTWVKVDQFHDAGFDARHVQIKSFNNAAETDAYLQIAPFPLDVYLATNGWLAVTLDGTFSESEATSALTRLKAAGMIPDDSYQTFGNTYMQRICCD